MPSPPVDSRILSVPKAGADASEYEDAAAVRPDDWPVRVAVADGATESIFARAWAETLVEGMTATAATPEALTTALPDWQARWAAALADRTEEAPWYAKVKSREGAFATLLGLELNADGRWRAVAVGDCGLFHLRDDTLQRAWPSAAPEEGTNRPALLPSRRDQMSRSPDDYRAVTGYWQPGDAFLLATDAVVAWLLRAEEQREGPAAARTWDADAFREAVTAARADDRLRNDDCTLLVLELHAPTDAET